MHTKQQVRSDRSDFSIPIDISWTAAPGRTFTKRASAIAITRYGTLIVSRQELEPTHQISIRCLGTDREIRALVLGQVRQEKDGYVYGLSLLDANVTPWDIDIPSADETKKPVSRHLLECDACQTRETVYLDEIQIEVFVFLGRLVLGRRCSQFDFCGSQQSNPWFAHSVSLSHCGLGGNLASIIRRMRSPNNSAALSFTEQKALGLFSDIDLPDGLEKVVAKRGRVSRMLAAYEDSGLRIKDVPAEETQIPLHPIDELSEAVRIREAATAERPDVHWTIVGSGPWGVRGSL